LRPSPASTRPTSGSVDSVAMETPGKMAISFTHEERYPGTRSFPPSRQIARLPNRRFTPAFLAVLAAFSVAAAVATRAETSTSHPSFEVLTHRMDVDVDGAPNAYGPPGKPALDVLIHAHYLERADQKIVGYLLDDNQRPILQSLSDPFPGYYVSQTAYADVANNNERDPRGYVDARKINYVVRGNEAKRQGVQLGDFVAVYSKKTHKAVFAIVGDTGNPTGDEGSLHLLQELGYPFHDGISDSVTRPEIVIRFYPKSNPTHQFFFSQAALDEAATKLGLSRDFSPALAPSRSR
jgi:Fungal chitosanase of glycosyl hydrolase group 75